MPLSCGLATSAAYKAEQGRELQRKSVRKTGASGKHTQVLEKENDFLDKFRKAADLMELCFHGSIKQLSAF